MVEFHPGGGIRPYWRFDSSPFIRNGGGMKLQEEAGLSHYKMLGACNMCWLQTISKLHRRIILTSLLFFPQFTGTSFYWTRLVLFWQPSSLPSTSFGSVTRAASLFTSAAIGTWQKLPFYLFLMQLSHCISWGMYNTDVETYLQWETQ